MMIPYDKLRKNLLKDKKVKGKYERQSPEFEVAHALIQARMAAKMTQKEVAKKMKTTQSAVARLESGEHLPTLQTLYRYATAINQPIHLDIQP